MLYKKTFLLSTGTSELNQSNQEKSQVTFTNNNKSFVLDNVELSYYDTDYSYLHDIKTNNTDKTIAEIQYGMLGYGKRGTAYLAAADRQRHGWLVFV